ncbi:hypothetical protein H0I62_00005, partial [Yersinia enterocolitica]|nr:hypothetical protein [Yersinia enterocolitica]
ADIDGGKTFKLKPTTIFRYRDDYWFAWTDLVDAFIFISLAIKKEPKLL